MNDILKQRLVGALILVALGVVFWPIIFVQPGDKAATEQFRIPPGPGVDTSSIEAPDLAGLRRSPSIAVHREEEPPTNNVVEREALAPALEDTPLTELEKSPPPAVASDDSARTRSAAPEKLVIDSDGVPVAWILQVASVSSADKADELRLRLLEMNHQAYVKKVKRSGKVLYRVYIGPKFERARLETMRAEIDSEFGVQSVIARYIP